MLAKWKLPLTAVVCLAAGGALGGLYFKWKSSAATAEPLHQACTPTTEVKAEARLSSDHADTVVLPPDVMQRLGVQTARVTAVPKSRPLKLTGSLMLDSNRLARIHSRFDGHIMSLGITQTEGGKPRPLQFGDSVAKDQVLAVIWSKEIGQKKSELLDAYSQLSLAKSTLDRLKVLRPGEVSEHVLRDAQRTYEGALIAAQNGERTLRSWQLTDAEVTAIRKEAERLHRDGASEPANAALREGWAELEVRAPFAGVVLEKNITVGEIVDANLDLFKIGDVSRLMVVANVYEEDFPEIERLPPENRRWRIILTAEPDKPPIEGTFELAGRLIDPVQHTAQVVGWIENPRGHFIAGQFISAVVELLPRKNETAVPATAVIESSEGGVIYTVGGDEGNEFTRHVAAVAHRGRYFIHLRSQLTEEEKTRGFTTLEPGTRIVSSGVVILESTWKELNLDRRAVSDTGLVQQLNAGP